MSTPKATARPVRMNSTALSAELQRHMALPYLCVEPFRGGVYQHGMRVVHYHTRKVALEAVEIEYRGQRCFEVRRFELEPWVHPSVAERAAAWEVATAADQTALAIARVEITGAREILAALRELEAEVAL